MQMKSFPHSEPTDANSAKETYSLKTGSNRWHDTSEGRVQTSIGIGFGAIRALLPKDARRLDSNDTASVETGKDGQVGREGGRRRCY